MVDCERFLKKLPEIVMYRELCVGRDREDQ